MTVKQLAQVVGTPVERLLNQLKDAGLSFTDTVNNFTVIQLSHNASADILMVNFTSQPLSVPSAPSNLTAVVN